MPHLPGRGRGEEQARPDPQAPDRLPLTGAHHIASRPGNPRLRFGDLEVVPQEGVVTRADQPVHLTKTEFRLLVELANHPGTVFSREDLLEKVWGHGVFGDGRLVDVHVRRLRTKVEADPANPRHVVTVRGLGYKLQS